MSKDREKKKVGVEQAPTAVCDHIADRPTTVRYKIHSTKAEVCWFCYIA